MRWLPLFLVCLLAAFTGCSNSNTTTSTQTTVKTKILPVHSKLSDDGTRLLMIVVNQYYLLKNALVASKAGRADSAALQLVAAGDSMQIFLSKDTAMTATIKPYLDTIVNYSKALSSIAEADCERQRIPFASISGAMYGLLKNVNLTNAGIYYEHCPMALNEKGAYWLSEDADIRNPYFGKKMLECGEVTDTLK